MDDCVCYREIKDTEDTLKLHKDTDQLGSWARKWGMRFQPVKCNMMQITRKRIKTRAVRGSDCSPTTVPSEEEDNNVIHERGRPTEKLDLIAITFVTHQ